MVSIALGAAIGSFAQLAYQSIKDDEDNCAAWFGFLSLVCLIAYITHAIR